MASLLEAMRQLQASMTEANQRLGRTEVQVQELVKGKNPSIDNNGSILNKVETSKDGGRHKNVISVNPRLELR